MSLFSGIGGRNLGFERAGMRVVFQCEADPWRRAVLRNATLADLGYGLAWRKRPREH